MKKKRIYCLNPLFPRRSLAPALFLLFEIAQAYIERRFARRGTPTVNDTRTRTDSRRRTGSQASRNSFALRPQQSPLHCRTPFVAESAFLSGTPRDVLHSSFKGGQIMVQIIKWDSRGVMLCIFQPGVVFSILRVFVVSLVLFCINTSPIFAFSHRAVTNVMSASFNQG